MVLFNFRIHGATTSIVHKWRGNPPLLSDIPRNFAEVVLHLPHPLVLQLHDPVHLALVATHAAELNRHDVQRRPVVDVRAAIAVVLGVSPPVQQNFAQQDQDDGELGHDEQRRNQQKQIAGLVVAEDNILKKGLPISDAFPVNLRLIFLVEEST